MATQTAGLSTAKAILNWNWNIWIRKFSIWVHLFPLRLWDFSSMQRYFISIGNNLIEWGQANKYRLAIVVALFGLLKLASELPYLNLVLADPFLIFAPPLALLILIVRVKDAKIIILTTCLFLFAYVFFILGWIEIAEDIANYIYVILFFLIVREIVESKA